MDKPEITKITKSCVRKHCTNKSRLYFRMIDYCNRFHARLQFLCWTPSNAVACARIDRVSRVPRTRAKEISAKLHLVSYTSRRKPRRYVLRQHVVFISGTWQNCGTRLSRGRRIDIPHAVYVESRKLRQGWALQSRAFPRNKLPSDKRGCG